jgi:hypothetical protein
VLIHLNLPNTFTAAKGLYHSRKETSSLLFWAVWNTSFTSGNVLSSFEATEVVPSHADAILKRFRNTTPDEDRASRLGEESDNSSWRQFRQVFDAAVKDKAEESAKKLSASIHSLQTHNHLLHFENEGLRQALTTKKKNQKESKPLDLQQRKEYHSGAVFWSPSKVRKAVVPDRVKEQEEDVEKLQKAEMRQLREASALYKKKKWQRKQKRCGNVQKRSGQRSENRRLLLQPPAKLRNSRKKRKESPK